MSSDITPNPIPIIASKNKLVASEDAAAGFAGQFGDLGGMNTQEALDILRNGSNVWASGELTTTDATPKTFDIGDLATNQVMIIRATVTAKDTTNDYYGGFIRQAVVKCPTTTPTIWNQIQDLFTMRDQAWLVDFDVSGAIVRLRVWGLAGQTVYWKFRVESFIDTK